MFPSFTRGTGPGLSCKALLLLCLVDPFLDMLVNQSVLSTSTAGVILAALLSRLAFLERHLAAVDGRFWRGDHTFQAATRIRSSEGRKDYAAIYSIMNEWSQIVGQWAVGDTSFAEYALGVESVLKRYDALGYQVCLCVKHSALNQSVFKLRLAACGEYQVDLTADLLRRSRMNSK